MTPPQERTTPASLCFERLKKLIRQDLKGLRQVCQFIVEIGLLSRAHPPIILILKVPHSKRCTVQLQLPPIDDSGEVIHTFL